MPDNRIIDAHCHLFNAQYALMEFAWATWNMFRGNYPHRKGEGTRRGVKAARGPLGTVKGVAEFAAWIARLVEASLSDCRESFAIVQKAFAESDLYRGSRLLMAPLMMDIYFALDDNKDEEATTARRRRTAPAPAPFAVPEDQKEAFNAHFDEIVGLVRAELRTTPGAKRRSAAGVSFDGIVESARGALLAAPVKARRGAGDGDGGIELSPGYRKHMRDIEELSAANKGLVFPFLAIDPRRIGIMDLIDRKVAKGAGVFKGIKLYPPLGYLPTHPNLQPVYEYCVKYDIPVTLHCSDGGIENFMKSNYVVDWQEKSHWEEFEDGKGSRSRYYTVPEKWLPVLERWPELRIDFAHFGGGANFYKGETAWLTAILGILEKYPRAYTDISYFAKPGLAKKVSDLVAQNPILAERLMFGTDYVMLMLDDKLGGLRPYFDRFAGLDQRLLFDNARAFLKID
jgi:predicted TIM-barrel fold metal-dependent hydrolase